MSSQRKSAKKIISDEPTMKVYVHETFSQTSREKNSLNPEKIFKNGAAMCAHDNDHFFDSLPSTNFCERLMALSVRCVHPNQQHGRRIPSFSSETTLSTCSSLFEGVLTEIVQQIHSLRASGVISSHAASALRSDVRALRRSAGIS